MFKIRMQGQYGGAGDKKLGKVVGDVWRNYGFRDGIMRGYWVSCTLDGVRLQEGYVHARDTSLRRILHRCVHHLGERHADVQGTRRQSVGSFHDMHLSQFQSGLY